MHVTEPRQRVLRATEFWISAALIVDLITLIF